MSKCEYFSNMNEIDNEDFLWNNNHISEKSEKKEFDCNSSIDFLDSTDMEVEFGYFEKRNNISQEITTIASTNIDFTNKSINKDSNHIQELLRNTQLGNKSFNNNTNPSLKNLHTNIQIVKSTQNESNDNFKNCNLSSNDICQHENVVSENQNCINITTNYQEEEEKIFNFKKESLENLKKDLDFDSKEEFEFSETNNSKLSNKYGDEEHSIENTKVEKNKSNIKTSFLGDDSNESLYTIKSRDLNTSVEFTEKYLKQVKKDLEKGIKRKLKKEVKKEIAKGLEKAQSMTNLHDTTLNKEIDTEKKIKEELRNQTIQLINTSSNETTLLRSILKLIMETDDVEKYCIFNDSFKTNKEDIDVENNKIDKLNEYTKKNININRNKMPFVPVLNKKSKIEDNVNVSRPINHDSFINNNSSDINKVELVPDKLSTGINNINKLYKKVPQNSTVELVNDKILLENNNEKLQVSQCKSNNIDPFESFNNNTCTSVQSKILSDSEDNMSIDIYEEHPEEAKSVFGSLFNMIIRKKEIKDNSSPEIKIFKKKEMEIPTGERIINSNAYAGKKQVDVKIPQLKLSKIPK